jgi:hypothetical protein
LPAEAATILLREMMRSEPSDLETMRLVDMRLVDMEALMLTILRLLVACVILVFYLPVISGVALAIIDAAGWLPGALASWWKSIGDMIAEGVGIPAGYKESMFTIWGIAALLSVIGHTLLSISRVRA